MIGIVDYGVGNRAAVARIFDRIGIRAIVSSDRSQLLDCSGLLVPGVGSFDSGMRGLEERGLDELIRQEARGAQRPILGICLGMQLLGERSEEGERAGLGVLPFRCRRFTAQADYPVPHMRWNSFAPTPRAGSLLTGWHGDVRAYFNHSYFADPSDDTIALARTEYGHAFASVVGRDSVFGVQFHPEKSHRVGHDLLANFARMCGLVPDRAVAT